MLQWLLVWGIRMHLDDAMVFWILVGGNHCFTKLGAVLILPFKKLSPLADPLPQLQV